MRNMLASLLNNSVRQCTFRSCRLSLSAHDSSLEEQGKPLSPAAALDDAVTVREFRVPLDHGGNAVFRLPGPVSDADIERIAETLKTWKSALVRWQSYSPRPSGRPASRRRTVRTANS